MRNRILFGKHLAHLSSLGLCALIARGAYKPYLSVLPFRREEHGNRKVALITFLHYVFDLLQQSSKSHLKSLISSSPRESPNVPSKLLY